MPLPADGPTTIGVVTVPRGHRVSARGSSSAEAIFWLTDEAVPNAADLYLSLLAPCKDLGLTPVLLAGLRDTGAEFDRPWLTQEFGPLRQGRIEDIEDWQVLREAWAGQVPYSALSEADRSARFRDLDIEPDDEEAEYFLEQVAPWGLLFPGLALAETSRGDRVAHDRAVREVQRSRVGLFELTRSSDIPWTLGWWGTTNAFGSDGPRVVSCVLRSWEDRFDARLFCIGFDTLDLAVGRPPSSEPSALAIAAELYALGGQDTLEHLHVDSIGSLSSSILNNPRWSLWWD
jgi:Domain of unknown function (DUF4253)